MIFNLFIDHSRSRFLVNEHCLICISSCYVFFNFVEQKFVSLYLSSQLIRHVREIFLAYLV